MCVCETRWRARLPSSYRRSLQASNPGRGLKPASSGEPSALIPMVASRRRSLGGSVGEGSVARRVQTANGTYLGQGRARVR